MKTFEQFVNDNLEKNANDFLKKENISKEYLKKKGNSGGLCWWFAKNFSKYLDLKNIDNVIIDMRNKNKKGGNHMVVKVKYDFIDFTMNQFIKSDTPVILKKLDYSMFDTFKEYKNFNEFIESFDMTDEEWNKYEKKLKHPKQFVNEEYELKYEKWNKSGYSQGYNSWNLYRNGKLMSGISNDSNDKKNVVIRHIENFSGERGMGMKLIFMLLDNGIKLETGKPDYNSISTKAYNMNKKITKLINDSNGKYKATILGKADNSGKEDYEPYVDVIDKTDNYHYKFEKK